MASSVANSVSVLTPLRMAGLVVVVSLISYSESFAWLRLLRRCPRILSDGWAFCQAKLAAPGAKHAFARRGAGTCKARIRTCGCGSVSLGLWSSMGYVVERGRGFEPLLRAWKACVLPLHQPRLTAPSIAIREVCPTHAE